MLGLYPESNPCTPQMCYVDSIEAWSVNEITVNWNSALSWIASFVADQGAGTRAVAPVVTTQPQSARSPRERRRADGRGLGRPAPRSSGNAARRARRRGRTCAARRGDAGRHGVAGTTDGAGYRAVFTQPSGSATTSVATLRLRRAPPVTTHPASGPASARAASCCERSASAYHGSAGPCARCAEADPVGLTCVTAAPRR